MEPKYTPSIIELQKRLFGDFYGAAEWSPLNFTDVGRGIILDWLHNRKGIILVTGVSHADRSTFCAGLLGYLPDGCYNVCAYDERHLLSDLHYDSGVFCKRYYRKIESLRNDDLSFLVDLGRSCKYELSRLPGENNEVHNLAALNDFLDVRSRSNKPTVITTDLTYDEIYRKYGSGVFRVLTSHDTHHLFIRNDSTYNVINKDPESRIYTEKEPET